MSTLDLANQVVPNLKALDEQFKAQHFLIVDAINETDETSLTREQDILDQHDDDISVISLRITQLLRRCTISVNSGMRKNLFLSLTDLATRLGSVEDVLESLTTSLEHSYLVHQYHEQLSDFKAELSAIRQSVLALGVESTDELFTRVAKLDKQIFDAMLKLKELLYPSKESTETISDSVSHGVRLPKLDVPTFDGDILNWMTFWEQFSIAVHGRLNLSNAEKLAYLRLSVKDGAAKTSIEGLSRSGEQYDEALQCLKDRYNRPKLIHEAHVQKIVEIPQ